MSTTQYITQKFLLVTVAGGLAMGMAFTRPGWSAGAWFAMAPMLVAVIRIQPRRTFLIAWAFHLGLFGVAFMWPAFHLRTDTAVISATALIALSMLLSLPYALGSLLANARRSIGNVSAMMITASLIVSLELLLEFGPVPMPWTAAGYSQATSSVYILAASVIGSAGIGTILIFSNTLFAAAISGHIRSGWIPSILFALLAIIPGGGSSVDTGYSENENTTILGIVQPGYSAERWADISDFARVDSLLAMSENVISAGDSSGAIPENKPTLLIWPETALPFSADSLLMHTMRLRILTWTTQHRVSLLTGGILASDDGPARARGANPAFFRNTAQLFTREGEWVVRGKNIMVPFAEYVPFSSTFPALAALAVPSGGVAGYLPDEQPSLFSDSGATLGVLICFESVFPSYARHLTKSGAEFLIVLTQDGWWNSKIPYHQHFNFARFRAAETGRSVIQVGVDGISGIANPDGTQTELLRVGLSGTRTIQLIRHDGKTIYAQFGYLFRILALLVWTVASFITFRTRPER